MSIDLYRPALDGSGEPRLWCAVQADRYAEESGLWTVPHYPKLSFDTMDQRKANELCVYLERFVRDRYGRFVSLNFNELPPWADPVLEERARCAAVADAHAAECSKMAEGCSSHDDGADGWMERACSATDVARKIRSPK